MTSESYNAILGEMWNAASHAAGIGNYAALPGILAQIIDLAIDEVSIDLEADGPSCSRRYLAVVESYLSERARGYYPRSDIIQMPMVYLREYQETGSEESASEFHAWLEIGEDEAARLAAAQEV